MSVFYYPVPYIRIEWATGHLEMPYATLVELSKAKGGAKRKRYNTIMKLAIQSGGWTLYNRLYLELTAAEEVAIRNGKPCHRWYYKDIVGGEKGYD